jgi:hypothetical protein
MAINPSEISTIRVGQLAASLPNLTDNIAHEIGPDLFRCTIQDLIDLLNINVGAFQYEVKTLYVNQAYINTNLDSTGLGINLLSGWAEINGNNGTPPAAGMFELSRKVGVYPIGGFGGSKDAVVVEHSHNYELPLDGVGSDNIQSLVPSANSDESKQPYGATSSSGVSGVDKNMPPYYVCLKIMKL